ncbi:conserved hypothetical protein [Thiomonas sp. CB3]|nr:conserved hypothetical protein [Thiomonas sp. CB3]
MEPAVRASQPQRLSTAVYAVTEPHRRACEARAALRLPPEARQDYMDGVRKQRGDTAAQQLRADMISERDAVVQRRAETQKEKTPC